MRELFECAQSCNYRFQCAWFIAAELHWCLVLPISIIATWINPHFTSWTQSIAFNFRGLSAMHSDLEIMNIGIKSNRHGNMNRFGCWNRFADHHHSQLWLCNKSLVSKLNFARNGRAIRIRNRNVVIWHCCAECISPHSIAHPNLPGLLFDSARQPINSDWFTAMTSRWICNSTDDTIVQCRKNANNYFVASKCGKLKTRIGDKPAARTFSQTRTWFDDSAFPFDNSLIRVTKSKTTRSIFRCLA